MPDVDVHLRGSFFFSQLDLSCMGQRHVTFHFLHPTLHFCHFCCRSEDWATSANACLIFQARVTRNTARGIRHAEYGICNKGRANGTCNTARGIPQVEYSTWIRHVEYGTLDLTRGIQQVYYVTLVKHTHAVLSTYAARALCTTQNATQEEKHCNITHAVREDFTLRKARGNGHVAVSK